MTKTSLEVMATLRRNVNQMAKLMFETLVVICILAKIANCRNSELVTYVFFISQCSIAMLRVSRQFLEMTKMPLLPGRKLPEVSSIGQVS